MATILSFMYPTTVGRIINETSAWLFAVTDMVFEVEF